MFFPKPGKVYRNSTTISVSIISDIWQIIIISKISAACLDTRKPQESNYRSLRSIEEPITYPIMDILFPKIDDVFI